MNDNRQQRMTCVLHGTVFEQSPPRLTGNPKTHRV
jgi:hypothetical protein